jgi:predicted Zn finger-like uncharacterized protein
MNVSCPECQTVFRVDPARVPGPGVRARCSVCGGIIPITTARSWTDDFATPHDAASLTSTTRPAGFANAPTASSPTAGARPAIADSGPRMTPLSGAPRSATPARVPPFVPGRRPTPPVGSSAAPASLPIPQASGTPAQGVPPTLANAAPLGANVAPTAPVPPTVSAPAPAPTPARPQSRPEVDVPRQPMAAPPSPPRASDAPFALPVRPSAPAEPTQPAAAPRPAPRAASVDAVPPSPRPDVAAPTPSKAPINPFLANDPNQKAKRLARALVSDMVAYHPQKRDEGIRAGTLKQLFREEIKKSYEEYVEQIGKEFAESTSHFQDALNDVLAGGKKVF